MNQEEYISKRNFMYNNIKKSIINDGIKYDHLGNDSLWLRLEKNIIDILTYELKKFTENKCNDWCDKIAFHIYLGIRGFFEGLVKLKKINNFTSEECRELFYINIINQLDDDNYSPCLLEDFKIYQEE